MKVLLTWRQIVENNENVYSGAIIIDEEEYQTWFDLLNKQDFPFEIKLTCNVEDTLQFDNGQELLDNVVVAKLDTVSKIALTHHLGNGIGVLNFYTDVIAYLDNDDFIVDMSDSVDPDLEKEEQEEKENL